MKFQFQTETIFGMNPDRGYYDYADDEQDSLRQRLAGSALFGLSVGSYHEKSPGE